MQAHNECDENLRSPYIDVAFHERSRLAGIFCLQRADLSEAEGFALIIEAIDLVVSLCEKRETPKSNVSRLEARAEPLIKQE